MEQRKAKVHVGIRVSASLDDRWIRSLDMRFFLLALAALVAMAAAAALPITPSAGEAEIESPDAPPVAAGDRSTEGQNGGRAPVRPSADQAPRRRPEIRWRRSI